METEIKSKIMVVIFMRENKEQLEWKNYELE